MAVVISMLRGVNVGGRKRMAMEALRELYCALGCQDTRTYVQSGNVVFKTKERDLHRLTKRIEAEIERSFGFHSHIIVRSPDEMRDVVLKNPFASRAGIDPGKLLVTFLASDIEPAAREVVLSIRAEPEELHVSARELYIYFSNGMGRTKLPMARIEKVVKTPATSRNWNTVLKLLAIAEEMQAANDFNG